MKKSYHVWAKGPYSEWAKLTQKPVSLRQAHAITAKLSQGISEQQLRICEINDVPWVTVI